MIERTNLLTNQAVCTNPYLLFSDKCTASSFTWINERCGQLLDDLDDILGRVEKTWCYGAEKCNSLRETFKSIQNDFAKMRFKLFDAFKKIEPDIKGCKEFSEKEKNDIFSELSSALSDMALVRNRMNYFLEAQPEKLLSQKDVDKLKTTRDLTSNLFVHLENAINCARSNKSFTANDK